MKKFHRGFTLVETAIVIAIVGVLASLTLVVYNNVQKQSRDSKRTNDMKILSNALEKYYERNGEYPPSCLSGEFNTSTNRCKAIAYRLFSTAGKPINGDTSNTDLNTILPGIDASVRDPIHTRTSGKYTQNTFGDNELNNIINTSFTYLYQGGAYTEPTSNGSSWSSGINREPFAIHGALCQIHMPIGADSSSGQVTSYVLAYYSEVQEKMILISGKNGNQPSLTSLGTPDKCVLKKASQL